MFEIPIDELKASHIQNLVNDRELESQYLEFKRQLPIFENKDSVSDMCGDIAAFANASGGYLIYGIDEASSDRENVKCASAIVDTSRGDEDTLLQRMSQIVQSGIEPKGFRVRIRIVTCDDEKKVVVVRVSESFRKPLRVKGNGRWYVRVNNLNSQMEYHQIHDFFQNSDRLTERVHTFRDERLAAILSNDSIAPFARDKLIVYHFVPLLSFQGEYQADLGVFMSRLMYPPACNGISGISRPTMDGVAFFGIGAGDGRVLQSKTEIFRSGVIEMVDAFTIPQYENEIKLEELNAAIVHAIRDGKSALDTIKVSGRIAFFLSIVNVGGMALPQSEYDPRRKDFRVSRRNLHFPLVTFETSGGIESLTNDTLRILASAFGLNR